MKGNLSSPLYWIFVGLIFVFTFLLWFFVKDLEKKNQKIVFLTLSLISVFTHFLVFAFPFYYEAWPYSATELTLVSICAINIYLLPFAFLSKHQKFKDAILIVGLIGGVMGIVMPTFLVEGSTQLLVYIRYYLGHYVLVIVPAVALLTGYHKVSYKSGYLFPLVLFIEMAIVFLNHSILVELGLFNFRESFLMFENGNSGFCFGPFFEYGDTVKILDVMVPKFMKKVPDGKGLLFGIRPADIYGGQDKYWPVLWSIGPLLVYGLPLGYLITCSLDFRSLKKRFKHE